MRSCKSQVVAMVNGINVCVRTNSDRESGF
jgi:hypothetical protein